MKIAARSAQAPASPIRRLIPYSDAAKARGVQVYHLNIGQPDIETPGAMLDAVRNSKLKVVAYAPSQGNLEYREAWVRYYAGHGISLTTDQVMVTTAGSEAITFAMAVTLDPGDEILVPEPLYANYLGFAALLGVHVVPITCRVEDGYHLPPREAFEARITPRTRAILFCNPGNPTGTVLTPAEMEMLIGLARDRNLFLIADEVYREFVYGAGPARSLLTYPEVEDRAIVVDSISKRYSSCGARIGCLATRNGDVLAGVLRYAQARLSPPTFGQILGQGAMNLPPEYLRGIVAEYEQRRDIVYGAMSRLPGVVCHKPGGALYLMARLPVDDAEKFIIWLLESFSDNGHTVMMAPANGFYATPGAGEDELRIAYVLNAEKLAHAMTIVEKGLAAYPGRR